MSLFSNQEWYCNACGMKMFSPLPRAIGREFKVCSVSCMHEMQWKTTLSTMGAEYYPCPETEPK